MLKILKKLIPERSPIRLAYHKFMSILALIVFRNPSQYLTVIGVTGTSGKSTTVNLIQYLLHHSGESAGSISTLDFHINEKQWANLSLRTTLSPWQTQKWLRKMVKAGCKFAIIEVSSHALDQHRVNGIAFDTALLTNIFDHEHLDYHKNFAEYVRTKTKLFKSINTSYRKPGVPKITILNRDDEQFEIFQDFPADRKWTYSVNKKSDVQASNVQLNSNGTSFSINLPNHNLSIKTPIIGLHNVENLLAAISVLTANGISVGKIEKILAKFEGIPGRLEPINEGQKFPVIVDFSYKPSGLQKALETLRHMADGKIIIIWGGAGGRSIENWEASAEILDQHADEIVLTTDDPYDTDPRYISQIISNKIQRNEGDNFFEIEDRYEAIRYAIFSAEKDDLVLVAGRGHEKTQTIGHKKIEFDDREICREILQFAVDKKLLET